MLMLATSQLYGQEKSNEGVVSGFLECLKKGGMNAQRYLSGGDDGYIFANDVMYRYIQDANPDIADNELANIYFEQFFGLPDNKIISYSVKYEYKEPSINDYTYTGDYYSATISLTTGDKRLNTKDYFLVKNGLIERIMNQEDILVDAIQKYNSGYYMDAFNIFHELANSNPQNLLAQYYTALMLVNAKTNKHIGINDKETRMREACWWAYRGYILDYKELTDIYMRYFYMGKYLPSKNDDINTTLVLSTPYLCKGYTVQVNSNGMYYFTNQYGTILANKYYDFALNFNSKGFAIVRLNKKYGVINTSGKTIVPFIYDFFGLGNLNDCETFLGVRDNTLFLIDKHGVEIAHKDDVERVGYVTMDYFQVNERGNTYIYSTLPIKSGMQNPFDDIKDYSSIKRTEFTRSGRIMSTTYLGKKYTSPIVW